MSEETLVESPPARLEAFGFPASPATVRVVRRSTSWRMTRALLSLFVGWGLAPVVALIPPHIPWAAGAVIGGGWFAWRFSRERVTLLDYDGACPRCGERVHSEARVPVTASHAVHCPSCGQGLLLEIGTS